MGEDEENEHMGARELLKRRWPWFAGGAAVLVLAGSLTAAGLMGAFDTVEEVPVATAPVAEVKPTPTPTPTPTPEPAPKVDVNIETTQFMPYTEVWNPPDTGENFWQLVDPANGYPEDGGTDFVLAHACENQGCAGDDVRTLNAGDGLTYRGTPYKVTEKLAILKTEIGNQNIWEHVPNRVVIITCILDPATMTYEKNEILIADPA